MINKIVAIVIITHKPQIEYLEEISLIQCNKILGKYPVFLIHPEGLEIENYKKLMPEVIPMPISNEWLKDYKSFNLLKLSPYLYNLFRAYKYILFYEPDVFVFRDDLKKWCDMNFDYIGAPWYEHFHRSDMNSNLLAVGNGGFSLRKTNLLYYLSIFNKFFRWKKYKKIKVQEDFVWNQNIFPYYPFTKKPNCHQALEFAVETNPEKAFTALGKLPFGIHGWFKSERYFNFFKPYIEAEGYQLGTFNDYI